MRKQQLVPCPVNVASETGRLRAVLLHRPGVEIERMTPMNCAHALYSDILDRMNVDIEYGRFCGVLEKWSPRVCSTTAIGLSRCRVVPTTDWQKS